MCLLRGLQGQPISCFMSFVYGFGVILSEKHRNGLSPPFVALGVFWPLGSTAPMTNLVPSHTKKNTKKVWNCFFNFFFRHIPPAVSNWHIFLSRSLPYRDNVMSVGSHTLWHFPHGICNWLAETNKLSEIVIGYSVEAVGSSFNMKKDGRAVWGSDRAEPQTSLCKGQSADASQENELPPWWW